MNDFNRFCGELNKTLLFGGLKDNEYLNLFNNHCIIKNFSKDDTVFSGNCVEKCIGIILKGKALVKKDNILLNRLEIGDIFGAVTLYNSNEHFVNSIIAQCDCKVAFISKKGIEELIELNTDFSKKYIEYLSERIYFLNSKIKGYTMPDASEKLFNYLICNSEKGRVFLEIKKTELAKLLNLSRASLYRAFDELEEEGKIVKNGKNINII